MTKEFRPTPAAPDQPTAQPEGRGREDAIRTRIISALGRPEYLLRVTVVPLWSDHFRVNVVTGADPTSVTIPNSFFVTADDAGVILSTVPPIKRVYS